MEVKACGLSIPLGDGGTTATIIRKIGSNRVPAGQDIAGIVKAVGSDVTSVHIGDQVTGTNATLCSTLHFCTIGQGSE